MRKLVLVFLCAMIGLSCGFVSAPANAAATTVTAKKKQHPTHYDRLTNQRRFKLQ